MVSSTYRNLLVGAKIKLGGRYYKDKEQKNYVITHLAFSVNAKNSSKEGKDVAYTNNFSAIPSDTVLLPEVQHQKEFIGPHPAMVVEQKEDKKERYIMASVYLLWDKKKTPIRAV